MAKSQNREWVMLVCTESGDANYLVQRRSKDKKLELKKYCASLRKHTVHKEKRI
ncbi:MAG: 50S ribosomal protein L33 [Planctomycetes bacterium]|nr:50S ribosomal protein L33 [Planctomycetota bacterium]